jgi:hypothetical protein
MLDVHPPHEAAHTWKDFFIHIATICVGLLIAIGLEQTVEAIHRHHEREELRAALNRESEQILRDTQRVEAGTTTDIQWLKQVESQVSDAARTHKELPPLPKRPTGTGWDVPDEPIYKAAKASTRIALLPDEEIVVYGELDTLMIEIAGKYQHLSDTTRTLDSFNREIAFDKAPGTNPYASATPEQLKQLHSDLVECELAFRGMRYWSRQARGATTALLQGERDLHKIETAERQFDKLP